MPQNFLTLYRSKIKRPKKIKINELHTNRALKHVIFSDQFDRALLERLCKVATQIKELRSDTDGARFLKTLLDDKGAELYFTQSSTRTFKSFEKACQILGMDISETRDTKLSSEYKGESLMDAVRMYSSYADILIMRSREPSLAECSAYLMNDLQTFNQRNVPIINAGSGADEHPTQALLDIYTIYRSFEFADPALQSTEEYEALIAKFPELDEKRGGPDNKVYGFCGDVGRGRTVRSLISLLARNYHDISIYLISPDYEKLKASNEWKAEIRQYGIEMHEVDDLEDVIPELDVLYMTRIQHEHDKDEDKHRFDADYMKKYHLTEDRKDKMKRYAKIMHPFPRNEEIHEEVDKDPRAVYFNQARNGLWVRAALIAYLLEQDSRISDKYETLFKHMHNYNETVL